MSGGGGEVFVGGVAVLGPGLDGWERSLPVLAGRAPWVDSPVAPPAPTLLAPAERRRAGLTTRLAMAAAAAAIEASGLDAGELVGVFGSSNGDGATVAAMLEALSAPPPRTLSPTQFHNSVHNAAAAYWSMGARSTAASTSIGCHDGTFPAALLRAVAGVRGEGRAALLCVYDAPLPIPLAAVRGGGPEVAFAMAMTVAPGPTARPVAALEARFVPEPAPPSAGPSNPALGPLYRANAAARSLPLLEALARREPVRLAIPYLEDAHLEVRVRPC